MAYKKCENLPTSYICLVLKSSANTVLEDLKLLGCGNVYIGIDLPTFFQPSRILNVEAAGYHETSVNVS